MWEPVRRSIGKTDDECCGHFGLSVTVQMGCIFVAPGRWMREVNCGKRAAHMHQAAHMLPLGTLIEFINHSS